MEILYLMGKNMNNIEQLKFQRIRAVKLPERGHSDDAGIDFFVPDYTCITLRPHIRTCIPTGILVEVPKGYALIAFNKSGIARKYGLDKLSEVIDHGYQGEIHISVVNTSNVPVTIKPGIKLMQFILVKIGMHVPIEIKKDLFKTDSERGKNNFGSTGDC